MRYALRVADRVWTEVDANEIRCPVCDMWRRHTTTCDLGKYQAKRREPIG